MINEDLINDVAYMIGNRFEAINIAYIKKICNQINEIGTIGPANLHRLEQMAKTQTNIDEINTMIAAETKLSLQDLFALYDSSGLSIYNDVADLYKANGRPQVPFADNVELQKYIESVKRLTANTFINMSNTTSVQENYRRIVDVAIDAVATGQASYNEIIKRQMTDRSLQGVRVQYASGRTRRLDSAIRMNILEGVRQVNNGVREQTGKEFGADGVEISAHALCALDHVDVQGKQYSNKDFEILNNSLNRPISTLNCKHITFPIIMGLSKPVYSKVELQKFKNNSNQTIEINGKNYTKYEATQLLRKLETEVRYSKEDYIVGANIKDEQLQATAKQKIKLLRQQYKEICEKADLEPKFDRMYVQGYNGQQIKPKSIDIKKIIAPLDVILYR